MVTIGKGTRAPLFPFPDETVYFIIQSHDDYQLPPLPQLWLCFDVFILHRLLLHHVRKT